MSAVSFVPPESPHAQYPHGSILFVDLGVDTQRSSEKHPKRLGTRFAAQMSILAEQTIQRIGRGTDGFTVWRL